MQLFPQALDRVAVRRVRWKKVQLDTTGELLDIVHREARIVDVIVVQHDLQGPRSPVGAPQQLDEWDEGHGVLSHGHLIEHLASLRVSGPKQVALGVFAGREHQTPVSRPQIGRPDPRVQMQVRLVGVEEFLLWSGRRHQFPNAFQDPAPASDRDAQRRPGPAPPASQGPEHQPDATGAEAHRGIALQLKAQQLHRPRRAVPAEILRHVGQIIQHALFDLLRRRLRRLAPGPLVSKSVLFQILETVDGAVHRSPYTARCFCHQGGRVFLMKQQECPATQRFNPASRPAQSALHAAPLCLGQRKVYGHSRGTPPGKRVVFR
jgi:hypothetical protein